MIEETAKEAIIKKALTRGDKSLAEIASGNNVSTVTLRRWVRDSKLQPNGSKQVDVIMGSGERFKHLKATFGQGGVVIGAYCRKHGLYPHQLTQWEAEFMTNSAPISKQQPNAELKALQAEVSGLKKTIMRKDKVLAETMALLILKKKATQIWGENEDD
jgi:transposase-like protein